MSWFVGIGVSLGVLVTGWALLALLAATLPAGPWRDVAVFIPAMVTTATRLRKDPRVPGRVKVAMAFAALWMISPIDPVPEFIPVVGALDDALVMVLTFRFGRAHVPAHALEDACPPEARLLRKVLGLSFTDGAAV